MQLNLSSTSIILEVEVFRKNILVRNQHLSQKYGSNFGKNNRKGNCWDNAVAESFFHTLKTELIYHEIFETRAQANQAIFEYIEVFYNRQRMHSANGNLSPVEFEEKMLQMEIAA